MRLRIYVPRRILTLANCNTWGHEDYAELGSRFKACHVKIMIMWLTTKVQQLADASATSQSTSLQMSTTQSVSTLFETLSQPQTPIRTSRDPQFVPVSGWKWGPNLADIGRQHVFLGAHHQDHGSWRAYSNNLRKRWYSSGSWTFLNGFGRRVLPYVQSNRYYCRSNRLPRKWLNAWRFICARRRPLRLTRGLLVSKSLSWDQSITIFGIWRKLFLVNPWIRSALHALTMKVIWGSWNLWHVSVMDVQCSTECYKEAFWPFRFSIERVRGPTTHMFLKGLKGFPQPQLMFPHDGLLYTHQVLEGRVLKGKPEKQGLVWSFQQRVELGEKARAQKARQWGAQKNATWPEGRRSSMRGAHPSVKTWCYSVLLCVKTGLSTMRGL